MPVFFNNCAARPHAAFFGPTVFYDLDTTGVQATMATSLKRGEECVVATPDEDGDIVFSWYSFSREEIRPNPTEPGAEVRVLFGKSIKSERLPKADAVETEPYSVFFNVNGHFKRRSVV